MTCSNPKGAALTRSSSWLVAQTSASDVFRKAVEARHSVPLQVNYRLPPLDASIAGNACCGLLAGSELERSDARMPVESAISGKILVRVPHCAIVDRIHAQS
jgi:hypothetical protein